MIATVREPATKEELIAFVDNWNAENAECDISEQMTSEEMVGRLEDVAEIRPPIIPIAVEELREIVAVHAPDAPHGSVKGPASRPQAKGTPQPPAELAALARQGHLIRENDHWFVNRCRKCGEYNLEECCGEKTRRVSAVWFNSSETTSCGRQAAGLELNKRPKPQEPPKPVEQKWQEADWWKAFSGRDEVESHEVQMLVANFLPEGVTLICGVAKDGKSYLALSIAKALTTGEPLFGKPGYDVLEPVPVLYLAAEVNDGAFEQRLEKFGIARDKTRFIFRTLTKGPRLGLDHPYVESLVSEMKPVVIIDTAIRFSPSNNEDVSMENQKFADIIFRLLALGARAVIVLHHSVKKLKEGEITLDKAVRGSGDMAAMADAVWCVARDERLYRNNTGPNEVDLIAWCRDFNGIPMRLALTGKRPKDMPETVIGYAPGLISYIDTTGDLKWLDKIREVAGTDVGKIEQILYKQPGASLDELVAETGLSRKSVQKTMKELGWTKPRGRGNHNWEKEPGGSEPVAPIN